MKTLFETDRLLVREFTEADLDGFAALCADATAMQFMGDGSTLTREEVENWIQVCKRKYAERGYGTSAVFEKTSGEFIGFCGVIRAPNNDFDEIIYAFMPSRWGMGYATEVSRAMLDYVFSISSLDKIYATIHPENTASTRIMDKIGMRFEKKTTDEEGDVLFYVMER